MDSTTVQALSIWVLFRCENILDFATVALSFVCGKYYPIME
jgi:hypothetical protein